MTRPGLRTAVVAVAGVAVLAVSAVLAAHQPAPPTRRGTVLVTGGGDGGAGAATGATATAFPWWLLVAGLVLLLVAGVLVWSVLRDSLSFGPRETTAEATRLTPDELARRTAELAAVADLALADAEDDLTAGADPREVVIACWVRIEAAADTAGLGRRPAETATDVARRWLAGSSDRVAVDDLAALYHLARYSTHPMTDTHRARARTALRGALGVTA